MDKPIPRLGPKAFAALCGTTKETLRHYRDLGLLPPAGRGENGYFYYDPVQFYDYYAISIFRQTGTPLEEIRRCLESQDTATTLSQLRLQRQRLDAERRKLEQMDFVLSQTIDSLELGETPDLQPRTAWFPPEHLLALPAEELAPHMIEAADEDQQLIVVLERCQALCRQYDLQTDYQLGAIHQPFGPQPPITHLYTRLKEKTDCPYYQEKPAGTYVYLCCRGRWDISQGYAALADYVRTQGLETAGALYAQDLAGFLLNGVEENAVSILAVRLKESNPKQGKELL